MTNDTRVISLLSFREAFTGTGTAQCGLRVEEGAMHELQLITFDEGAEEELSWQERSLCAQTDPEAFFPEKGGSTREAKKVCIGCEVRSECLEYALANDERFGIWGGLSERERRRLKKRAV
jgi:WhiB family redox-sensing transcriptional regulator